MPMSLFDQCQSEKIQRRQIEVSTHACDETHILVWGELHDRRLVTTYSIDGQLREPDSMHHMHICLKVAIETLTIVDAEVRMPRTPHEQCAEIQDALAAVVGLRLVPGFSGRVRRSLGGPKGCIHLTTLLLAMAPAALQGYWTHHDRVPERRRITREHLERYLVDTCHVWRRGGENLRALVEKTGIELS